MIPHYSYRLNVMTFFFILVFEADIAHAVINPQSAPYLQLEGETCRLSYAENSDSLAFTDRNGRGLSLINLKTQKVTLVSPHLVGPSFFWSPDGFRLFFRELVKDKNGAVESVIKAFDTTLTKTVQLHRTKGLSGFLSFDPLDLRFQLMTPTGIVSRRISFPDERLAKWQAGTRTERGRWLATQNGILWLTHGGLSMTQLKDDHSGLESFALSSTGDYAAWATKAGRIYVSLHGAPPRLFGWGLDPAWHPSRPILAFAAAERVGTKVVGYDLKLVDANGAGRKLTRTAGTAERWPAWIDKGKALLYTSDGSTDIHRMELKE